MIIIFCLFLAFLALFTKSVFIQKCYLIFFALFYCPSHLLLLSPDSFPVPPQFPYLSANSDMASTPPSTPPSTQATTMPPSTQATTTHPSTQATTTPPSIQAAPTMPVAPTMTTVPTMTTAATMPATSSSDMATSKPYGFIQDAITATKPERFSFMKYNGFTEMMPSSGNNYEYGSLIGMTRQNEYYSKDHRQEYRQRSIIQPDIADRPFSVSAAAVIPTEYTSASASPSPRFTQEAADMSARDSSMRHSRLSGRLSISDEKYRYGPIGHRHEKYPRGTDTCHDSQYYKGKRPRQVQRSCMEGGNCDHKYTCPFYHPFDKCVYDLKCAYLKNGTCRYSHSHPSDPKKNKKRNDKPFEGRSNADLIAIIDQQVAELAEANAIIAHMKAQHLTDKTTIDRIGEYFADARRYIENASAQSHYMPPHDGMRE